MNYQDDKILVYGAGKAGQLICRILEICGIHVYGFLDNDISKNGNRVLGTKKCLHPSTIRNKKDYLICCGISNEKYIPVTYKEMQRGVHYNVTQRDFKDPQQEKYFLIYNGAKNEMISQAQQNGFERFLDFSTVVDELILKNYELLEEILKIVYDAGYVDVFLPNHSFANANNNFAIVDGLYDSIERIAVYTGIFGEYDEIHIPKICPKNIDYYFVSDRKPETLGCFNWIDARTIIPEYIIDPIKRNRYIKMHPHLLFPQSRYTIYVDGALQIIDDISGFVNDNTTGISAFKHYERDCLYYEGLQIVNGRRVVPEDVYVQLVRYLKEGMPIHFGLAEMSVIACDHANTNCDNIMEAWWREFVSGAQRDQLSFTYVLWKLGFKISDVSSLGSNFRESEKLKYYMHPKLSEGVKNG